ncbi:uncharacterized protein LOC141712420 isoform X6 [Apium graveolens]|uniref:uncharacterized protein LOC141712420 isoform X6 n=1 Tax=Apium graveolens TaxID=4045 RepID=UPI003D78DEB1
MESKNKKNKAPPISNSNPHPHSHLFQTLVSAAAAAPNGLKSSLLRKLYYVLVELSRSLWSCKEEGTGLVHFVYEIVPSGMRVTSEDLCRLSDILFKEFCKCFKQCNSDLSVSSDSKGDKQAISHPDMLASSAELSILLRCCLKIQDLLNQQGINDENGRRLFVILRTLSQLVSSGESSISLEDLCSSKICYGEDGSGSISAKEFVALICSLELTDSCIPVLSSIIERQVFKIKSVVFDAYDDASVQDVCFLTSLLKLISISLLQSLWCLWSRHKGFPESENLSSCKEYQCITSILDSFTAQNIDLPIKNSLCNQIESKLTKHEKSKLMLFHFLRLLSFSFLSGFDCLANSCILCIVAIMNLIVFEEGNLKALKSVDIGSRFPQKVARGHKSTSLVIAAKFLKMQSRNLSKIPPANVLMTIEDGQHSFSSNSGSLNAVATVGNNRNTAKTCDGVNYLRCIGVKSPDDDLADFIECKEGKDYSAWLKDRDKNRKRKYARQAVLIQKKKKNALKLAKAPNINDN